MAGETKFVLPLLFVFAMNYLQLFVYGEPQVPCLYIFGDSLSDNGNNNNLITDAKTNYKPYGIDFQTGLPTGRFTNNLTVIDIIGKYLGFKDFIPPFANTSGSDILKGVNYASGGAGIRYDSGSNLGAHISFGSQIDNHRIVFYKIAIQLGGDKGKAQQYLNKCLYYVNIGSNDYINNYFLPWSPLRKIYSLEKYATDLIEKYSRNIQELRTKYGARKFVLNGIGLIGCTPNAISTYGTNGSCVDKMNAAAYIFNNKLKALVDQFNNMFSADSKFIFINSTAGSFDSSLGFTVANAPCCPTRKDGQCVRNQMPCENRNAYVFWDDFHPTGAVNEIVARAQYKASNPPITYPMDINHLVQSG